MTQVHRSTLNAALIGVTAKYGYGVKPENTKVRDIVKVALVLEQYVQSLDDIEVIEDDK